MCHTHTHIHTHPQTALTYWPKPKTGCLLSLAAVSAAEMVKLFPTRTPIHSYWSTLRCGWGHQYLVHVTFWYLYNAIGSHLVCFKMSLFEARYCDNCKGLSTFEAWRLIASSKEKPTRWRWLYRILMKSSISKQPMQTLWCRKHIEAYACIQMLPENCVLSLCLYFDLCPYLLSIRSLQLFIAQ